MQAQTQDREQGDRWQLSKNRPSCYSRSLDELWDTAKGECHPGAGQELSLQGREVIHPLHHRGSQREFRKQKCQ